MKPDNKQTGTKSVTVHFRLSPEEYTVLEGKANEIGCNVSQLLRKSLFPNSSGNMSNIDTAELKKQSSLSLNSVRNDFKKISSSYVVFVDSYKAATQIKDRNGDASVNTEQTIRTVNALQEMTLRLQESLNGALRIFGMNEEHSLATDKGLKGITIEVKESQLIQYYNMERIEIIGKLAEDATAYKSKTGSEKARLKVSCESTKGGKKTSREWLVFYAKSEIVPVLVKGKAVYVAGDFTLGDNGDCIIFADILKFVAD